MERRGKDKKKREKITTEQSREMKTLPEKTLGILVRKLFTVRMGMPFFSSCMRAITSSIWTTQGDKRGEEEESVSTFYELALVQ